MDVGNLSAPFRVEYQPTPHMVDHAPCSCDWLVVDVDGRPWTRVGTEAEGVFETAKLNAIETMEVL